MKRALLRGLLVLAALAASTAGAEPRFALQTGFRCAQCHANPSGGGLRNTFGNAWALTQLAARSVEVPGAGLWTGIVGDRLAFGGNLRANAEWVDVPHQRRTSEFRTEEARLYLDAAVIPGRLSFYVDERVAPGSAENMEANARLWLRQGTVYVKAGRMYLPFGWRLEDDNAFVRQLSGINMQAPDSGVEAGYEHGPWSAQFAVSNGTAGGPETDNGKQYTARVEHVRARWRLGGSFSFNDSAAGRRRVAGVFGGFDLGPTSWLGEFDHVDDDGLGPGGRKQLAGLAEVNWLIHQGHNLKATWEWLDPDHDVAENEQTRASLVYEWSPIQFLQLRVGFRRYDGIPQNDVQNRSQAFVQLHAFF